MAPDTSGDGTGCDNMTCLIVLLNQVNTRKYFVKFVSLSSCSYEDYVIVSRMRIDQYLID